MFINTNIEYEEVCVITAYYYIDISHFQPSLCQNVVNLQNYIKLPSRWHRDTLGVVFKFVDAKKKYSWQSEINSLLEDLIECHHIKTMRVIANWKMKK